MSFDPAEFFNALKTHFETAEADARTFLEQHLPGASEFLTMASANPVVRVIAGAAHLNEVPEYMATVADMLTKADAAMEAQQAAGVAKAQAAAAAAAVPPEAPAEPPVQ